MIDSTLIELRGVTKTFFNTDPPLTVLRCVDFKLNHSEMVSIVGLSGSGKSTLLHILGTLDEPTAGEIIFEGQPIHRWSAQELAKLRNRTIGFVFQFHHLLPDFSALENAMMPLLIARNSPAEARRRSLELLELVGLKDRLRHRPSELSGGEQQRVALARALVMRPKVLLADEPTGNLDSQTSEGIHQLFSAINKETQASVVVVTHNQELALRMPRQLRMVDGNLLTESSSVPAQPLASPAHPNPDPQLASSV